MRSTKALVTGGAGFIGSALARQLLNEGWTVRVLDNLLTGSADSVPDGAELLMGDIRVPEDAAAATEGVDVVFHQAAVRSVSLSVEDPLLTQSINVQGTLQMLLAAREAHVGRFVNASTCAVYGGSEGAAVESQPLDPQSPYAVAKMAAESYTRLFSTEYGLEAVSLRYFNVFGPGQHPESGYSAVFPAFIEALTQGATPEVHWDGEQTRDFVAIDDIVRANILAATAEGAPGGIFNVASGTQRSVNEILRAVASHCGVWAEPKRTPRRPGDVRHAAADTSSSKSVLGFEATADFAAVVAQAIDWFRGISKRP